jgi:hypothetical protein
MGEEWRLDNRYAVGAIFAFNRVGWAFTVADIGFALIRGQSSS